MLFYGHRAADHSAQIFGNRFQKNNICNFTLTPVRFFHNPGRFLLFNFRKDLCTLFGIGVEGRIQIPRCTMYLRKTYSGIFASISGPFDGYALNQEIPLQQMK